MSDNKNVLYDFEWQSLRTSLDFSTAESTKNSISKCKKYLEDYHDINKVWRVLNLMSATRMGFSGSRKLIKTPEKLKDLEERDSQVLNFREKLSSIYRKLKKDNQISPTDNIDKLKKDLIKASTENFGRVYESLIHRYENSNRSGARSELRRYLDLMREVLYSYRNDQKEIENFAKKALQRLKKEQREKALKWDSFNLGE